MHGRAEIAAVLFHQRPVTAHLPAIGGVDAGVEIDDRALQGLQRGRSQQTAGNGEDRRRLQQIGGLAAFFIVERGELHNGKAVVEIGRKAVFGDDLVASANREAFAEPRGDHRRYLARSDNPAKPSRASPENDRLAFRLLHEDVDIGKSGSQSIDHDIGVHAARRHHQKPIVDVSHITHGIFLSHDAVAECHS
ncbi:hypothetical protein D3C72_1047330 [compost metagenome]